MKAFLKNFAGRYALQIFWRGDEGLEEFEMQCESEGHMKQWESVIITCLRETQCSESQQCLEGVH
jgi:hypothetical protein